MSNGDALDTRNLRLVRLVREGGVVFRIWRDHIGNVIVSATERGTDRVTAFIPRGRARTIGIV